MTRASAPFAPVQGVSVALTEDSRFVECVRDRAGLLSRRSWAEPAATWQVQNC